MPFTQAQIAGSTTVPPTYPTAPVVDNPSAATNVTPAVNPDTGDDPDAGGGDLAAAITLLAKTLATQKNPSVSTPALTRLREPDTLDGSDANQLQVFILQCSLHFQDRVDAFSSDIARVTYALSFLQLFA